MGRACALTSVLPTHFLAYCSENLRMTSRALSGLPANPPAGQRAGACTDPQDLVAGRARFAMLHQNTRYRGATHGNWAALRRVRTGACDSSVAEHHGRHAWAPSATGPGPGSWRGWNQSFRDMRGKKILTGGAALNVRGLPLPLAMCGGGSGPPWLCREGKDGGAGARTETWPLPRRSERPHASPAGCEDECILHTLSFMDSIS